MKLRLAMTACLLAIGGSAGLCGAVRAETIVSVTQYSYNYRSESICVAVRMNPSTFSSLPSDPCTLAATGTYGPDRITHNTYDSAGQLTQVDESYGVTADARMYARYTYSNNGLTATERDANGDTTQYTYDGFDRPSRVYYPVTSVGTGAADSANYEEYGYDSRDNKTSWRRRDGQTIYYTYDNLNREITKDLPGTTSDDVYTIYDGLGRTAYRRFASFSGSGLTYNYDGLGRLWSATDYNGRTVTYGFNQASARVTLTHPDGNTIGYALDNANRIATIGYDAYTGLFAQNYDNLGNLYSQGKASGTSTFVTDSVGRLSSLTNDLNGTSYDAAWSFNYNPAGQIASTSASSTVYDYRETASSTVNQTYDGLNRDAAIAAVGGGYDSRGNLTYDGARTFTYDIENRLLTAVSASANVKLVYDPEGRLAKYSTDGGSSYSTFLYDGGNLIAEYDPGGAMTERYVRGSGTDTPLVWLHGSGTTDIRWLYTDQRGSIIGYTDNVGSIVNYYKYGAYGEPKTASDTTSFTGPRFRYTGQTVIPEAGLYYYKARVYDPSAGRFLQTDPIGSADDLNLYAYVGDDPINRKDPTGTQAAVEVTITGLRPICTEICYMGMVEQMNSAAYYRWQNGQVQIDRGSAMQYQIVKAGFPLSAQQRANIRANLHAIFPGLTDAEIDTLSEQIQNNAMAMVHATAFVGGVEMTASGAVLTKRQYNAAISALKSLHTPEGDRALQMLPQAVASGRIRIK